ncbi:HAMP domain-containing histidine kinase [Ideonella sp. 4Y16]|uniref:sensor histidine kinase n=1 Tax=Ideonella alba TaxID=2824118 RepID=UPI001B36D503|nr:HAMP domain-containing sensor histidine kinase [Ideonella alba]MBQ0941792.1 HAMP domain-containing histidine kinase [Ideonella alba]
MIRLRPRIPLRLRFFFRAAFALLALAVLGLALTLLAEEKERAWRSRRDGVDQTLAQIGARLRHPTGQLALMNPEARPGPPLRPLVLPFGAIDFDDRAKAQQAVEMAGCALQYADAVQLCAAVGSNPAAGGFLYLVGQLPLGPLAARAPGDTDFSHAHRAQVRVAMRGREWRWLAPYELPADAGAGAGRGKLTGFAVEAGTVADRPQRDFRGWLWQDARCIDGGSADDCLRRSYYSLRLPVELFREDLQAARGRPVWPPADLDRIEVHLRLLGPGDDAAAPLFDSDQPGATPPFTLAELARLLQPGESLRVRRLGPGRATEVALLSGPEDLAQPLLPLLERLIRALPVQDNPAPLQASDTVTTPTGRYELQLTGDRRGVDRALGRVATRTAWFVGALLLAIGLTWAAIELRVIRRITLLTRRAAAVRRDVKEGGEIRLDVAELRGSDELGVLAGTLAELMQRVNEDVHREHIRARQEKDQWHAVGHEILSPLQSLLALHGDPADPSHRYIQRMQQAVRVLYGQASPTEAFQATALGLSALDLDQFLRQVAENAPHAGIDAVAYEGPGGPLAVQGDDYALEDVVTHVLRNAARHRWPGTPITMQLQRAGQRAELRLHNQGPQIEPAQLERIFEYGVSDAPADSGSRGQGLFVARTWMAKMGGTIVARNEADGVSFVLSLPLA